MAIEVTVTVAIYLDDEDNGYHYVISIQDYDFHHACGPHDTLEEARKCASVNTPTLVRLFEEWYVKNIAEKRSLN